MSKTATIHFLMGRDDGICGRPFNQGYRSYFNNDGVLIRAPEGAADYHQGYEQGQNTRANAGCEEALATIY